MKKLPLQCPACSSPLVVTKMSCHECDTSITGDFDLPLLAKLTSEEQDFIIDFIKSSGSLKEMAVKMKLSYPTVRNILDDLIMKIRDLQ